VTLTSGYGLKVIGLNSLPNSSFMSQVGFSPGFKLTNSNHVTRDSKLTAAPKVYLCLVQSDSMGIGAWTEPGARPDSLQLGRRYRRRHLVSERDRNVGQGQDAERLF